MAQQPKPKVDTGGAPKPADDASRQSEIIDLGALWRLYREKWLWFAVSILVCGTLGVLFALSRPKVYGVRATVMVSDESAPGGTMGMLGDMFGASSSVDNEVEIIASHSVLRDVARDMGLNRVHKIHNNWLQTVNRLKDFPLDIYAPAGVADTLMTPVTFKVDVNDKGDVDMKVLSPKSVLAKVKKGRFPVTVKTPYGRFTVDTTAYFKKGQPLEATLEYMGYDLAAEALAKDLEAEIVALKADLIDLAYDTPYPRWGMEMMDNVIAKYNARGIAEKNRQNSLTLDFLDGRIALLSQSLDSAEMDIQSYKEQRGLVTVESEAKYNFEVRTKNERALVKAETDLEILQMTRQFLSDPANHYSLIPYTSDAKDVGQAIDAYNALVLKRMELERTARGNNAALRTLTDRIDAMRANIDLTLAKAYETSLLALNKLRQDTSSARGRLAGVPAQEREFRDIQRQQALKQELYIYLLKRREETAIMLANAIPKGTVIDQSYTLGDPVSIPRKLIVLIALVIGCCIPPIALYVRKLTRTKFSNSSEFEAMARLPILGEICTDKSGRALVVSEGESTSVAELFRAVRTQMDFILNGADDKVVMVTSTRSGEGKSFIAANLAAAIALRGKRVVLVGMDIRKPRLAEYLGLPPSKGVTQFLADHDLTPEDIILRSPVQKDMDVIVAGPVPPNPAELLVSPRMDTLVEWLRAHYDYVILDTAPVGMVSDTFNLSHLADATIYVVRANYTRVADVRFANRAGADGRLTRPSFVVNGTAASRGYGYGYGEGHKKKG